MAYENCACLSISKKLHICKKAASKCKFVFWFRLKGCYMLVSSDFLFRTRIRFLLSIRNCVFQLFAIYCFDCRTIDVQKFTFDFLKTLYFTLTSIWCQFLKASNCQVDSRLPQYHRSSGHYANLVCDLSHNEKSENLHCDSVTVYIWPWNFWFVLSLFSLVFGYGTASLLQFTLYYQ